MQQDRKVWQEHLDQQEQLVLKVHRVLQVCKVQLVHLECEEILVLPEIPVIRVPQVHQELLVPQDHVV